MRILVFVLMLGISGFIFYLGYQRSVETPYGADTVYTMAFSGFFVMILSIIALTGRMKGMKLSSNERKIAALGTMPLCLLSVAAIAITGYRVASTDSWKPVQASISAVEYKEVHRKSSTIYRPIITAHYTVDSQSYDKQQMTNEDLADDPSTNTSIQAPYTTGQEMTVYTNPAAPKEMVLEKGLQGGMLYAVMGGILVAFLGLGMSLMGFSKP